MVTSPWLSDDEVDEICAGLRINAAKCRHLASMGLTVNQKPNGRPLVMRAHAERVLSGDPLPAQPITTPAASGAGPNRDALVLAFQRKKA